MYIYEEEYFDDVIEELKPLIEEHYFEVENYLDSMLFDPDYELYSALAAAGHVHVLTARSESGGIVGYTVTMVNPSLHCKKDKMAVNDALYVDPDHRGTECAVEMLSVLEKHMRSKDVSLMTFNMKAKKSYKSLMDKLGFKESETVFTKLIKEN
jgi:GNAT superfamily N-acetyltransferase